MAIRHILHVGAGFAIVVIFAWQASGGTPPGPTSWRSDRTLQGPAEQVRAATPVAAGGDATEQPGEHFQLENAASLTDAEAERVYRELLEVLREGFADSGLEPARRYLDWPRHNRAPYRSATHGERYVNNYANRIARDYGRSAPLPVGSVLAKDAVTVTATGDAYPGTLALMEKMEPGFDPEGGDWRYTLVMPDGSILGTSGGANAAEVAFCRDCHLAAGEATDFLFGVPESFRRLDPEAAE